MHCENNNKTDNPKVSVIVPVYNVAHYLRQCLESLVNQTLREMEIICVNDGSTDNSLEILEEYACRDIRIKIISKSNSGYGASMNLGMEHVKGKYIGIVESDDFADKEMFERLYSEAEEMEAEIIKSNYFTYTCSEDIYQESLRGIPYDTVFKPAEQWKIFHVAPSIWSGLYRTDFIRKFQIKFQETPGASFQDISFFYLTLLHVSRMVCIRDAFLHYRFDNVNSSVHSTEKVFCIMSEFNNVQKHYKKENRQELMEIVEAAKFRHYLDNYNRIDSLFQYAWLCKMNSELVRDKQEGLFVKKYWSEEEWKLLWQFIDDADEYFKTTNVDYINRYQLKDFTQNHAIQIRAIKEVIQKAPEVVIYGAGVYAEKITGEVEALHPIKAYAVTNRSGNDKADMNGIRICEITELVSTQKDILIIVAVKKTSQKEIVNLLYEKGFRNIITVNGPTLEAE